MYMLRYRSVKTLTNMKNGFSFKIGSLDALRALKMSSSEHTSSRYHQNINGGVWKELKESKYQEWHPAGHVMR